MTFMADSNKNIFNQGMQGYYKLYLYEKQIKIAVP